MEKRRTNKKEERKRDIKEEIQRKNISELNLLIRVLTRLSLDTVTYILRK